MTHTDRDVLETLARIHPGPVTNRWLAAREMERVIEAGMLGALEETGIGELARGSPTPFIEGMYDRSISVLREQVKRVEQERDEWREKVEKAEAELGHEREQHRLGIANAEMELRDKVGAEREACAKVADVHALAWGHAVGPVHLAQAIAAAIRARGAQ